MPILPEPNQVVLDTSALLTYLSDEAGAETVSVVLRAARDGAVTVAIPTICLAELMSLALPTAGPEGVEDLLAAIERLPLATTALDGATALDAALAAQLWHLGYPEAVAAIAAGEPGTILLTANPLFASFERSGGRVYWIGPESRRNAPTLFDPLARLRGAS